MVLNWVSSAWTSTSQPVAKSTTPQPAPNPVRNRSQETPSYGPAAPVPPSALPKGKACLGCRRRKVRCDAQTPCLGCTRMQTDCVYEEEHERVKRLMGKVAELEARLKVLLAQTPNGSEDPVLESAEEENTLDIQEALSVEGNEKSVQDMETEQTPSHLSSTDEIDLSGDWWLGDPRPDIQIYLVEMFFARSRSGFQVHRGRFIKSLSLPPKSQPHPGLLNVIYTIACRLSQNPMLTPHEPTFLARARHHLAKALATKDRLSHFLAGSTLLAYYLFISGRFLEGANEVASAARFAIVCNLHKISRPVWRPPSIGRDDNFACELHAGIFNTPLLPPPIDGIDLGERISLFWTTLLLDHSGSLVTGLPPNIPYEEIETVWPIPLEQYEKDLVTEDYGESVQSLFQVAMSTPSDVGNSPQTLHMKAIVLLGRASRFASYGAACSPEQRTTSDFQTEFQVLYDAITRFANSLASLNLPPATELPPQLHSPQSASSYSAESHNDPGPYQGSPKPDPLFLVHTYAHVACMHLYSALGGGFGSSEPQSACLKEFYSVRLGAAQNALRDLRALDAYGSDFQKLPMMLGFAWGSVAHVFAQHVLFSQEAGDEKAVADALDDFHTITASVRLMCTTFPILEFQLERLRVYGVDLHPSVQSINA